MASRLANVAPVGSLLKGDQSKRQPKPQKSARKFDGEHLDAIRQCPCIVCLKDPAGVAAHVRFASAKDGKPITGIGVKPDDERTVPLCPSCHTDSNDAQHVIGEAKFWARAKIDPIKASIELHKHSPNIEAMRQIVFLFNTASRM